MSFKNCKLNWVALIYSINKPRYGNYWGLYSIAVFKHSHLPFFSINDHFYNYEITNAAYSPDAAGIKWDGGYEGILWTLAHHKKISCFDYHNWVETIHYGINSQLCMLHSFKVSVNIQIQWRILRDLYLVDLGWMADSIFFVKFSSDSGKRALKSLNSL